MITMFPLDNTEYTANPLGAWFATRTRGVFSADDNLRVVANNNMTVTVRKGLAWLKVADLWGGVFVVDEDITLPVPLPSTTVPVQAAVVCRYDKNENLPSVYIRLPTDTSWPLPERDSNADEIIVGYAKVRSNTTAIVTADISDSRTSEDVCGIMRDGIEKIPTQALYEQAEAVIEQAKLLLKQAQAGEAHMLGAVYDPQQKREDIFAYIDNAVLERSKAEHPVGSYYWSEVDTNPANIFGFGTWQRAAMGRVLVGVNPGDGDPLYREANQEGGEREVALTTSQMPRHAHSTSLFQYYNATGTRMLAGSGSANASANYYTAETGGSQPHENMPPFETAYCWKRTA